jgi:hypothetical protein
MEEIGVGITEIILIEQNIVVPDCPWDPFPAKACHRLYFGKFRFEGRSNEDRYRRGYHLSAPHYHIIVHPVDPVSISIEIVEAQFIFYKGKDEQATGNPNAEPGDIG